jgi:3-hydroxy-3-methylglutaryl CoA synthase
MWIEAGFDPDAFWHQTPDTFTLAMKAVRQRLERESDDRVVLAWQTGVFAAQAQAGKLKPLRHYLRKQGQRQSADEMLAIMRTFQACGAAMRISELKR